MIEERASIGEAYVYRLPASTGHVVFLDSVHVLVNNYHGDRR